MKAFQDSLPMMLYRVLGGVLPRFRLIFSDFGLTEQQWRVLRVLWDSDAMPLLLLSEQTLIPGPSLVGVVDRLERNQLVQRNRSRTDRRLVCICLTEEGKSLEQQVTPRVDAAYEALEGLLEESEWRSLHDSMRKIIAGSLSLGDELHTSKVELANER